MIRSARHLVRTGLERVIRRWDYRLVRGTDDANGAGYENTLIDRSVTVPDDAAAVLQLDNPRLRQLAAAYDALDWPVVRHSRWAPEKHEAWLDPQHFRGDNSYIWHYRESERISELKYFIFLQHVAEHDDAKLLGRLEEDGAFGCWTFRFPGHPPCSRDLLDSVSELSFLHRCCDLLDRPNLRVLDIGAGYGRLGHRTAAAANGLVDYCCVDAVAMSTFLSEFYTHWRGVAPPVRVVPLFDVPELVPGSFDIAYNVHSFSECTLGAIKWWVDQLVRLDVPMLFIVPNEPDGFLSLEEDGTRHDYRGLLESAGYRITHEQPAFRDDAVRALLDVHDRYYFFERTS